ncbi:hypothetical protein [Enterococcus gilvus]|uniref:hypothetical protein n=1 Tax=Enterococcus gilvus TaxID=160453 RepID=UPI003ED8C1F7
MGNIHGIRAIEEIIKNNPRKFFRTLDLLCENGELDELIRQLKISKISVDEYGSGRSRNKYFREFIDNLPNEVKNRKEFIKFMDESMIFNKIYHGYDVHFMQVVDNLVCDEDKFMSFLIAMNENLEDVSNSALFRGEPDLYAHLHEVIIISCSTIIKYFKYKKYPMEIKKVSRSGIENSYEHFVSIGIKNQIETLFDLWSYSNLEVFYNSDGTICTSLNSCLDNLNLMISKSSFYDARNAKFARQAFKQSLKNQSPLDQSNYVKDAEEFLAKVFYLNDCKKKFDGIPLDNYIKAYRAIYKLSKNKILHKTYRKSARKMTDKNLINLKKYQLISLLIDEGIERRYTERLIEFLTFDSNSNDLLETPLLEIEDSSFIILPQIGIDSEPSSCIVTNFSRLGLDIGEKGTEFEHYIYSILSERDIKYVCPKQTNVENTNDHYQCDLVFSLDKTIYFCEIKHWLHPMNERDFALFKENIDNATLQLNRLVDYYTDEKNRRSIEKELEIEIKNMEIRKLIITNVYTGTYINKSGTSIVSSHDFKSYFEKNHGQLVDVEGRNIKIEMKRGYALPVYSSESFNFWIKERVIEQAENQEQRFEIEETFIEDMNFLMSRRKLVVGSIINPEIAHKDKVEAFNRIHRK